MLNLSTTRARASRPSATLNITRRPSTVEPNTTASNRRPYKLFGSSTTTATLPPLFSVFSTQVPPIQIKSRLLIFYAAFIAALRQRYSASCCRLRPKSSCFIAYPQYTSTIVLSVLQILFIHPLYNLFQTHNVTCSLAFAN